MVRLSLLSLVIRRESQFITSGNKLAPAAPTTPPQNQWSYARMFDGFYGD